LWDDILGGKNISEFSEVPSLVLEAVKIVRQFALGPKGAERSRREPKLISAASKADDRSLSDARRRLRRRARRFYLPGLPTMPFGKRVICNCDSAK